MLCPGISLNTEQHQLTFFNGQILEEKSYLKLCNHNVLNILYSRTSNWNIEKNPIEKNGKLYVPPELGLGFIEDGTQIPWDSEILQSLWQVVDWNYGNFSSSWFLVYQSFIYLQPTTILAETKIADFEIDLNTFIDREKRFKMLSRA